MGRASRLWLHYSLIELNKELETNLILAEGNPEDILFDICKKETVKNIFLEQSIRTLGYRQR